MFDLVNEPKSEGWLFTQLTRKDALPSQTSIGVVETVYES